MARPGNKEEYRAQLAESFARLLEEKGPAWKQEWSSFGAPRNGVTDACYRGCNAFLLSLTAAEKGYSDPRWVTMNQIMDRSGRYHPETPWHLKKGSKASYVEYWFPKDLSTGETLTWEQYHGLLAEGRDEREFRLVSRYTPVFNASEVEGIPEPERTAAADVSQDELVRRLSWEMGVPVCTDGGDQAWYSPQQDAVHLPVPEAFSSSYDYNATALHELSHSTGHPSRLNRMQSAAFGTEAYAYEELVAEMSACFLASELRTEPTEAHLENHKAYIRAWTEAVRDRPDTLVRAIRDAQSAADYMDFKAGLITEQEYQRCRGAVVTRIERSREMER